MKKKKHNIILTGGGTAGSVTPLLAIADTLSDKRFGDNFRFFWIGTKKGVERKIISERGDIKYTAIFSGKLRRYFSWHNFVDPIWIFLGFIQSIYLILKIKPLTILSVGSFVGVPLVWAGWLLRVPVIIHQQDIRPGLANKMSAPFARYVTVTFEESVKDYGNKAKYIGNFIRKKLVKKFLAAETSEGKKRFGLTTDKPIIMFMGGGTGAASINNFVFDNIDELTKNYQVVHLTGSGKGPETDIVKPGYVYREFLNDDDMAHAYRMAEVVVSRCGMGTLTELSYFLKPTILVPMPNSHQVDNAAIFSKRRAAIVVSEDQLNLPTIESHVNNILNDDELRAVLSKNINLVINPHAIHSMINVITSIIWSL